MGRRALKETAGYPIKKAIVGFIVSLFTAASFCAAGGFIYLKYLEARLHKGDKGLDKVISKPIGDEPVNFLLLGSDARGKERARTDTIILLHLDVRKKRASLVSIPRDMRVEIPNKGLNKINAAYAYGGPELMVQTVENFTSLSIHHYVETDFEGFKRIVDALGGVDVYIDKPMKDRMAGAFFSRGYHTLNGDQALAYVRSRHSPQGDFDRVGRQQVFLKALYRKAKAPVSITKLPKLISLFAENTTTDLSTTELFQFASFVRSISEDNIETVTMAGTPQRIKGISYVISDEAKNREILARVKEGKSLDKPVLGYSEQVSPKDVRVEILNGSGVDGAAGREKAKLEKRGFVVVGIATAASSPTTQILYRNGQNAKARCVQKYFPGAQSIVNSKLSTNIDVRIILGKDDKEN